METASQFLKRASWKLLMWMTEEIKMDKKKKTPKQIAALGCVGLLVLLYVVTLVVACLNFPGADRLFQACLVATVGLPILLWIYMWLYGKMKDRFEERDSEE